MELSEINFNITIKFKGNAENQLLYLRLVSFLNQRLLYIFVCAKILCEIIIQNY